MSKSIHILAFYEFSLISEDRVTHLQAELRAFGAARDMRGLVLLATEGINGTVCGSVDAIGEWKTLISGLFPGATCNESGAEEHVFPRWLVKVREEIVALGKPDSTRKNGTHLTPQQWNEMMNQDDAVLIDARNNYETKIGMFEGAIDPALQHFQDFPSFARACDLPKDAKVMLYCTGGIRCEKAVVAMQDAGFTHVYQLQGGILSYLRDFPNAGFRGECFVFDHRVAVDQQLQPSTHYKLCSTCGDPGTEHRTCDRCTHDFVACTHCVAQGKAQACSKNCRYHHERQSTVVS